MLPAILRTTLNMFNFPAYCSQFSVILKEKLIITWKNSTNMLKNLCNLHYRLIFVQLYPYQGVTHNQKHFHLLPGKCVKIMREWLIGQFRSHLPLKRSSERKCCLKVGRLFVMDYCENLSKVVNLKVHCLHCTGPIRQFETNFG